MPGFNALVEKYKSKPVNFLAISRNKPEDIQEFVAERPFNVDHIALGESIANDIFHITWGYPTTIITDENYKIIFAKHGGADDSTAVQKIQDELIPVIDGALKKIWVIIFEIQILNSTAMKNLNSHALLALLLLIICIAACGKKHTAPTSDALRPVSEQEALETQQNVNRYFHNEVIPKLESGWAELKDTNKYVTYHPSAIAATPKRRLIQEGGW